VRRRLTLGACAAILVAGAVAQAGYVVGTLAGQDLTLPATQQWSGGSPGSGFTNNYAQEDSFPETYVPGDQPDRGESVVDTMAHSGTQSWHFKRGYDSPGSGTPFSPSLSVAAGRPSSGAAADRFEYTFWFKAASATADDSRIMVAGGPPAGNDRSSNYMEVFHDSTNGLTVRHLNHDGPSGGWGGAYEDIATGLEPAQWHKVTATGVFADGDFNDTWNYDVDNGAYTLTGGDAYFAHARDDFGYGYVTTDRLKFQPRHANWNVSYQGFYFDDVSYAIYDSSDPATVLDSYETSFENPPVADADGPYWILNGQPCILRADGSYDQDGSDLVSYQWEIDGVAGPVVTTAVTTYSWAQLKALFGVPDYARLLPVTLTVTDDEGMSGSAGTTLSIVPEPTSLALLGGAVAALARRRRRRTRH